jgi:co-chaperonin GroES (HSP10)
MQLTHDKVLIKLKEHPDHTLTESNIYVPKFVNIESDGGRPLAVPSNEKYVAEGTVIQMSPLAAKKMEESYTPLKVGDRVFVSPSAVSQSFHFRTERDAIVYDFDGMILIPYILIEAIL